MEATNLMGKMEMYQPNGYKITIQIDGSIIKEMNPLNVDWCPKCEKWKPLEGGEVTRYEGLDILWLCQVCK